MRPPRRATEFANDGAGVVTSGVAMRKNGRVPCPSQRKPRVPLEGRVIGRWLVEEYVGYNSQYSSHVYRCRCSCEAGTIRLIRHDVLNPGTNRRGTKSCGCLARELVKRRTTKHGHAAVGRGTRTYRAWRTAKDRCKYNIRYIAAGIRMCPEWEKSFAAFLNDLGECPSDGTLDRIDNDVGYAPGNTRWATQKEQANNTKRNHFVTYLGQTKTLSAWTEQFGFKNSVVRSRLSLGKTMKEATETPLAFTRDSNKPPPSHAFRTWRSMRQRCKNMTVYLSKGITVCDAWQTSFDNFSHDVGEPPTPKHTLDRIDNDGHYSCGHCEQCKANGWTANCRWATRAEQSRNKAGTVFFTCNGRSLCLTDWAKELRISPITIQKRLAAGDTFESIVARPLRQRRSFTDE